MSNLPTLVFVPGAWHRASCYDKLTKLLTERYKLKCVAVTLPSTSGDPAATFKDDLDAAHEAISAETSHRRDVIVIAHSYGGMVGNSAIKGFTRPPPPPSQPTPDTTTTSDQDQETTTGHVIGLILIASGFTLTGMAFMDPFLGRPPPSWRANWATGFAELVVPPQEFFYHDLPREEADYHASQLTPQSLKALYEGAEYAYAGWRDLPFSCATAPAEHGGAREGSGEEGKRAALWYVGTAEDRGLPLVAQRANVGMARAMGVLVEHRELKTSHSPFLSRPEETAGVVVEAVRACTGMAVGEAETAPAVSEGEGREVADITVPAVRLWQPVTWYRFGLPLALGNFMGKGVLVFEFGRRVWRALFSR